MDVPIWDILKYFVSKLVVTQNIFSSLHEAIVIDD